MKNARPLSRLIQENKKPLAEDILFGKLKKGVVKVYVKNDNIFLEIPPPEKPRISQKKPYLQQNKQYIFYLSVNLISILRFLAKAFSFTPLPIAETHQIQ